MKTQRLRIDGSFACKSETVALSPDVIAMRIGVPAMLRVAVRDLSPAQLLCFFNSMPCNDIRC